MKCKTNKMFKNKIYKFCCKLSKECNLQELKKLFRIIFFVFLDYISPRLRF